MEFHMCNLTSNPLEARCRLCRASIQAIDETGKCRDWRACEARQRRLSRIRRIRLLKAGR